MITIVVAGYNRLESLERLLKCINDAEYYGDSVHLIISIDKSENSNQIKAMTDSFDFKHGEKEVILHRKRLGLREHFLFCGDLTKKHGNILFLEDDIYVLPGFYGFAKACVKMYENDERIGGISLYSIKYSETAHRPFTPLNDGSDVYFAQLISWAPVFFQKQWKSFRDWYNNEQQPMKDITCLPDNVRQWSESSFKKYYLKYMINNDVYFVYPQTSFATNFAEVGQHYIYQSDALQVPLSVGYGKQYRLVKIEESFAVYDAFLELSSNCLKKLAPQLREYDFSVDLYGNKRKENITAHYCITSKKAKNKIDSWGCRTVPHETNIMLNVRGDYFVFSRTDDISFVAPRNVRNAYRSISYDIKGASPIKAIATDMRILLQEVCKRRRASRR